MLNVFSNTPPSLELVRKIPFYEGPRCGWMYCRHGCTATKIGLAYGGDCGGCRGRVLLEKEQLVKSQLNEERNTLTAKQARDEAQ